MSKHIYFSLDSDFLSNLAELDVYLEKYPNASKKEIIDRFEETKQSSITKNVNMYKKYLEVAKDKNSPVRFLVTQTPWRESKHIDYVQNFVIKYCYTPKVKYLQQSEVKNQIAKLARTYCKKIKNSNGDKIDAPMSIKYDASQDDLAPSNDAYVMAEATVFGACVLTENVKDFIDREPGDKQRVTGIVDINKTLGYEIQYGEGFSAIPKPWAVDSFGRFLGHLDDYKGYLSDDEDYEMAEM